MLKTRKNANGHTSTQAGRLHITETHIRTRHYECAAWYQDVEVKAGTVCDLWHDGHWFYATIPGTVTGSNFTSRIGACHGKPAIDEDKGKPGTAGYQADSYTVGKESRYFKVELFNHWRIEQVGEYSDGEPMRRAVNL